MRGRNRFFPLIDFFSGNPTRLSSWVLIFFLTAFSGCARLSPGPSQTDIWRSTEREPVWIRHDLPPGDGFVYLKASASSRTNRGDAREKARGSLADMLVGRFVSEGFHFTDRSRRSFYRRLLGDIASDHGPLRVVDSWETKTLPNPANPFLVERHAWILVRAPADFVSSLGKELQTVDRERFRRIRSRHRKIYREMKKEDGTEPLLLLAENRRAFRSIHSRKSLSRDNLRQFDRYVKSEYALWSEFAGSATVRSVHFGRRHPMRIPLPLERPTLFLLEARFKMAKRRYPLQNFDPRLSLSPVLSLLPFPPPPILWRGKDVSSSPYRLLSLYWSADLGWYDRYKEKNRLVYRCLPTSLSGTSQCHVYRWPLAGESSILHVRFKPVKKDEGNLLKQDVAKKVHGRFPVRFPGPRGRHPLMVLVQPESSGRPNGPRLAARIRFLDLLKNDLSGKGFLIVPSGGQSVADASSSIKLHQPFRLTIRWRFPKGLSKSLGGSSFVVRQIVWNASVSDPRGIMLWNARGNLSGAGVGEEEALNEAMNGLRKTLAEKLSRLLWVRPAELPDDRFVVMRMSLLDGRAYCGEEESP